MQGCRFYAQNAHLSCRMSRFFLQCLLAFLCLNASGAGAQIIFSSLYPRDGLSSKEIFCTYTDSEGFLWCGTANGLNRWDGSRFRIITPYSKSFPGLLNETVYAILEWEGPDLWVGTDKGLSRLDKRSARFSTVPFLRGRDTLGALTVHRLIACNGRLWCATQRGLFVFSGGAMHPVSTVLPAAAGLDSLRCITYGLPDGGGAFWVRADSSLYYLDPARRICYSSASNPLGWAVFSHKHVTAMALQPGGRVWFADYMGLYRFDSLDNSVTAIPGLDKHLTHRLYPDRSGRLWISTTMPAAYLLSPDGTLTFLGSNVRDGTSLGSLFFHHVHEDRFGNIWFGTANGLHKRPVAQPLQSLISLPSAPDPGGQVFTLVNALQRADDNHLWICKDDGLYLMDIPGVTFKRYAPQPKGSGQVNRIFDIQRIGDEWWCGTGKGILRFDPLKGTFTPFNHYAPGRSLAERSVMWMRTDREGYVWYAGWIDALYRYDPRTKTSIAFPDTAIGQAGRYNSNFGFPDSRGRMWLGYSDRGIRQWDAGRRRMINPMPDGPDRAAFDSLIVYNMVEDDSGSFWLATDRLGVVKLDRSGHIRQTVSLQEGLHTRAALYVWLQPGGRLWIATVEGIQTLETSRTQLSGLDLDFGTPVKDYSSVITGFGGRTFVSTNGGLAVLDLLHNDSLRRSAPMPLISGVRVFEEERAVPMRDSSLRLRHDENFFSIDFSSPLHHEVSALQYSYMLEGFDKDWVDCGRRQTASYTNVPPGTYTFKVRTTNGYGEWQPLEGSMQISIRAPFWQRPWFTALWIIACGAALWTLVSYVRARRQRQNIAQTIDYFANSVYGQNSVDDICWDIGRNCIAQMRLEDCVVYLKDEQRQVLLQKAAYGPKNPHGHDIRDPMEIEIGKGIVGAVAATGKPILVRDTRKDPRYLVDDDARLSELAVPIIHDGEVIGVIDTEHSSKGFYTEVHLKALTTIASICANKIAEAQAEAAMAHNERELLQTRSLLADSQLMALRAQMNPHFVFNSLNSIQECIVTGKYGDASNYLNKFSKLFRALLENSGKPLIPLAEEIAVLELYLSLEHMRFEASFDYRTEVDEDLEAEEIMIPSMLLQPFVENALWHGLMHKDGDRSLVISFESLSEDMYRCTIDDNGIGRAKAAALKAARSSGKGHISRGMQITADRIALMQRRGQAASLQIIDKHDADGKPSGTRVVVELSSYLTISES